MTTTYWDVETGPLPLAQLQDQMPDFEPDKRLTDEKKVMASIQAKRDSWLADAALSPMTGQVLAIGLYGGKNFQLIHGEESSNIADFWAISENLYNKGHIMVGFNTHSFDLPFILKRGLYHGIKVPEHIGRWSGRYWNWSESLVDIRLLWQMGDRMAPGSLDSIARFLRVGKKSGSGADFARLYATDQKLALEYLRNDLELTEKIYLKMKFPSLTTTTAKLGIVDENFDLIP